MTTFFAAGYSLELFNIRNEHGALRAIRCWGEAEDEHQHLTLWFIPGEPMPRVARAEDGRWEASFPLGQFEPLADMLRYEGLVHVTLAEPDRVMLQATTNESPQ
ncbi:MAG: hypothetical protein AUK47_10685 [Deltaproteobacteria bacterium CG2_30_63_29]|nr:MAG: hypothetical protein AUK47_10685 [Deltaproteobacteria bacterium CG2_30_63_29]